MSLRTTHGHWVGGKPSSTYIIWQGMISRCTNVKAKDYPRYGGRGITIDPSWKEFINFLNDMGVRPEKLQLDRIDNSGNYCKDNCQWITAKQNTRKRNNTLYIAIGEDTKCLSEWCEIYNLRVDTVWLRINKLKWPETDWFNPIRKRKRKSK